jgi:hypothetical protein
VVVAQNPCIWMATLSILGPNVGRILLYFQKTPCVITPKYDMAYSQPIVNSSLPLRFCKLQRYHHNMARPQIADGGTASIMEGSCEYIE